MLHGALETEAGNRYWLCRYLGDVPQFVLVQILEKVPEDDSNCCPECLEILRLEIDDGGV